MLPLFFIFMMIAVFGKMLGLALRLTWGFTKILFALVFLPVILIGLVLAGVIYIALPVLIIVGVITFISSAVVDM